MYFRSREKKWKETKKSNGLESSKPRQRWRWKRRRKMKNFLDNFQWYFLFRLREYEQTKSKDTDIASFDKVLNILNSAKLLAGFYRKTKYLLGKHIRWRTEHVKILTLFSIVLDSVRRFFSLPFRHTLPLCWAFVHVSVCVDYISSINVFMQKKNKNKRKFTKNTIIILQRPRQISYEESQFRWRVFPSPHGGTARLSLVWIN